MSYHKRRIPPAQIIQVSELLKNSKVLGEDSLENQVFKGNSQEFENNIHFLIMCFLKITLVEYYK